MPVRPPLGLIDGATKSVCEASEEASDDPARQDTIDYFKNLSTDSGIPYQTLINLYLRDCATNGKKLAVLWQAPADAGAT